MLQKGDCVAADKGFTIDDLMAQIECQVVVPPKKPRGKPQLSAEAAMDTARQANLRIHVERAFARIRTYKYFEGTQLIASCHLLGEIFCVAGLLSNFQLPLVSKGWRQLTAERSGAVKPGQPVGRPKGKRKRPAKKSAKPAKKSTKKVKVEALELA